MPDHKTDYAKKLEDLLIAMPDFVSDFIYNFGQVDKYTTKIEYCRDIKMFLDYIVNYIPEHSDKDIKDLTLSDLENMETLDINRYLTILSGSKDNGLKNSTLKRKRASLSSMYGFFMNTGKILRNPIAATRRINLPEKNLIYLSNEEQTVLLNTIRYGTCLKDNVAKLHNKYAARDSAMFLLMLDTGLRVSEMLDTDISDYNLTDCSVVVNRKGGDVQMVYFSDECADYLEMYFDAQRTKYNLHDEEIPAFTTTSGKRLGVRAVEMLVKKYIAVCIPEKAKVISPHKLRSSFAMSFYNASGNDILLLQKKLNHKNISTTNIYAKAADVAMRESRGILQGKR